MTKIFKIPFATQGDRNAIPDAVQGDGSVSYTQGYSYDYERDQQTDPAAKDIEREKMNALFHDITGAIGELQSYGIPLWAVEGKPYPIRSVVYHKNKTWQSKIENNNVEPAAGAAWQELKADLTAGDIQVYNKTESDKRFQPLGNYQTAGYSYSKAESDTHFQPKGNYAPAGNYAVKGESYTKAEGDTRYQPKGSYQPSGDYALKGSSYTKSESDGKYQPKGSYQAAGYSYSKAESDTSYQPKGNYAPAGNYALKGDSYTKAEGDGRYQPKGSYQPSGDYATNSTVNSKFDAANSNANNRVPNTRKVNNKPLSADITITASDVGAYTKAESDTKIADAKKMGTDAQVTANAANTNATNANNNANGRVPNTRKVNNKALSADISLNAGDVGAYTKAEVDSRISASGGKNTANKTDNGWWKCGDTGMMLQNVHTTFKDWSDNVVNFPIPFPNKCINVVVSVNSSTNNPGNYAIYVKSWNAKSVTVYISGIAPGPLHIMAMGY
ncbi:MULTISPECIES: gp53-like domain-containing protein [Providencia]|uniref:gp53-like domain-containing protein n=1 Tax=Providencia TaxID=586 RepID=UPI00234ACFBB|nr:MULTISPECIES: phage tail protein [unclassified Providencia]